MMTYTLTQPHGPMRKPITGLADLVECQRAYIERRDSSGLGASRFGDGHVTCVETGETFRISYNGRLWFDEPWTPGATPLMEAPQ
jgi:hypothetical protein